jgi:Tfp pilus assembly protein PilF
VSVSANLEKLLADGRDSAELRFALGTEYLKQDRHDLAIRHLSAAVQMEAGYSAAWKHLGKAQAAKGLVQAAKHSFARGIAVALERGDEQAAREMRVFLRRLAGAAEEKRN